MIKGIAFASSALTRISTALLILAISASERKTSIASSFIVLIISPESSMASKISDKAESKPALYFSGAFLTDFFNASTLFSPFYGLK